MAELTPQPTSIQSIYGWYSEDRLYVNRRYQRKLVWTLEEKQKLIESILKKYPIPSILLATRSDDDNRYEIIDGLQRLNAIVSFIEGAFATLDNRYFNIAQFVTAKARMDEGVFQPNSQDEVLDQKEVSVLLDYTLALSIMRGASEQEVDEVFDRINSYGHRLSDQERRQAGIENDFSEMVRDLACTLRGDESETVMPLAQMPAISIDLPLTKHGYLVRAEEVFWVDQGILRSTDLRDSMDEQCIADIAASIVTGGMIERSKDELDSYYNAESEKSQHLLDALRAYGDDRFSDEFKFCVDQIQRVCNEGGRDKLRTLIYEQKNTNAFPAVFSLIFVAFHELFISEKKKIVDYGGLKKAINNLTKRIDTSRRATSPDERQKNVNTIKGVISPFFADGDLTTEIYSNHSSSDIDAAIRRSALELSYYELKQGIVSLNEPREVSQDALNKIHATICGIANNGPDRSGKLIIGVADTIEDAERVKQLDKVDARMVGEKAVVGVDREAKALGLSLEKYHSILRDSISKSGLSDGLKASVLSSMDYHSYYGLGVIIIAIPPQSEPSFFNGKIYWRDGDNTRAVDDAKLISDISRRF